MRCPLCGQSVAPTDRRCTLCGEELGTTEIPSLPGAFEHQEPDSPTRRPSPLVIPAVLVLIAALGLGGWWFVLHDDSAGSQAGGSSSSTGRTPLGTDTGGTSEATDPSGDGTAPGSDPVDLTPLATVSAESTSGDGVDAAGSPVSYDVSQLTDGSLVTTWRMDGDGSGSSLLFEFPQPVSVSAVAMTNGYTKVDPLNGADRYAEERRITQATLTTSDDAGYPQTLTDGVRELQQLTLPATTTSYLILTIDTTTPPGDPDRDYTAISEIRIHGTPQPPP